MTRAYGCRARSHDSRDRRFRAPAPYTGAFVDLTLGFPEGPYDQGQLGSCVSNGTAAAVDFARVKQGLQPLDRPSRLFIYYQGRKRGGYPIDQDTGLEIRDGFKVIAADGAPPERDWPYDISQFAVQPPTQAYADGALDQAVAYGAVQPGDVDAAVASGYPVVFGIQLYESFESQAVEQSGIVPIPADSEQVVGGHCMVIVSTPKPGSEILGGDPTLQYRKVRNSWGTGWGIGGYCWMPLQMFDRWADDFWTVTLMEDPNAPVPPPGPPPRPQPSPQPGPSALEMAVAALVTDQDVATIWAHRHHFGAAKVVAEHMLAILKAAQS